MKRQHLDSSIAFIVIGCLLLAAILILTASKPTKSQPTPVPMPTAPIQEDDPRWDCRTMGNRICGPLAPRSVVVEPRFVG